MRQRGNAGVATRSTCLQVAAAVLVTAALSGCAAQKIDSIAADDEALCQYSAGLPSADPQSYAKCRSRIQGQRTRVVAQNAARIEGYALLPAATPPVTDVAGRCKTPDGKTPDGAKNCPAPSDVTGTIPAAPVPPKP